MVLVATGLPAGHAAAEPPVVPVGVDAGGALIYDTDGLGNRVPDFSNCGYAGADRPIPDVPVVVRLAPTDGDDGLRIQAALDRVASLPLRADGFRGAVLLAAGEYSIAGQLQIAASGVVLRGSGAGENGTTLVAAGQDRRALIRVAGVDDRRPRGKAARVIDPYVPVGARRLRLDSTAGLHVHDTILLTRPSTAEWIETLGMDRTGIAWKPGTRNIGWDRIVTAIDGDTITLDAPITTAIEQRFGGAIAERYDWPGRIENVGIEDIRLVSAYDPENPHDEEHAWFGVTMEHVASAWVRRAEFRHFTGGAVALWESTKWITVEDCIALAPVSEQGGYRRHTFFTQGQLTLFLRCWSEEGRHDFAVGHCAAGPNAFVNCRASRAKATSGPVESWAAGVLYDNVRIDGGDLRLDNRWMSPPGAGWAAANCILWQCRAARARGVRPPTANNWAVGVWAEFVGDGTFAAQSDFVRPISLYRAQLRERRGSDAGAHVTPGLPNPVGATSPTVEEAAEFAAQSNKPARQLIDVIRERCSVVAGGSPVVPTVREPVDPAAGRPPAATSKRLSVENGWLLIDGILKMGGHNQQAFWRGTVRPNEAATFGPAITRFVPGRIGTGFTDDLEAVAHQMLADGVAVFDHHYGLWYDRRRDDHLMVRRADGNTAPPFYEQPFARTGRGVAWDGLSKYDLTKFNPWYWRRLRDFARLCEERGLVLVHQNYFQHNILEAGAHWADYPWRPANNVNDTGLPEPPPYIGDKRIFLAQRFYDVSDPRRRQLHRRYIRQCLDNFAESANVLQMTSAEYSGPLEFTQFWIDTIIEWKDERRRKGRDAKVLVGLSATKDVQDAILADPVRGPHVDVIDIRYWTYMANGELYAPEGGKNLAPRQHLRQLKPEPSSFASIVRAVRQYRTRYPGKAVTYYADLYCRSGRDGWAVLIGGGSLPDVKLPPKLAAVIPTMRPAAGVVSGDGQWCLANDGGDCLIYSAAVGEPLDIRPPGDPGATYQVAWIDAKSGDLTPAEVVTANGPLRLKSETNVLWLSRSKTD